MGQHYVLLEAGYDGYVFFFPVPAYSYKARGRAVLVQQTPL